jgi:hypothetical protein
VLELAPPQKTDRCSHRKLAHDPYAVKQLQTNGCLKVLSMQNYRITMYLLTLVCRWALGSGIAGRLERISTQSSQRTQRGTRALGYSAVLAGHCAGFEFGKWKLETIWRRFRCGGIECGKI